ncbi:class I adenylate-forming enzyme family protein (plasmid) [Nocardioides sp. R1-1]|uniref:class I adenylate-forming enzyme family protein n=1 Tax=Nocardioides sp. R1-1 TaxID=3383502 RepID=UPI0038D0980E
MTDTTASGPDLEPRDKEPRAGLGGLLRQAAQDSPDAVFLEDGSATTVTFGAAWRHVSRSIEALRARGLAAGDRIGILLPNDVRWPLTWLAVTGGGFVAVPINCSYETGDVRHVLDDAQVAAMVTDVDLVSKVSGAGAAHPPVIVSARSLFALEETVGSTDAVEVTEDSSSLANLQYTSGTSGMPKACMLTHGYWLEVGRAMSNAFELTSADRLITAQPFSYIDPMWMTVMSLQHRIPLVVLPRFSASRFWDDVRRYRATVLYVLGSMPQLLLGQPATGHDTDNDVRLVLCSAIPAAVHADLEARWNAPWREAYGLTESGLNILAPLDDPRSVGQGLLGVPAPGWRVRVVDSTGADVADGQQGELLLAGPSLMLGYWNRPEATAAVLREGWFHTGDLAIRREDGWLRLVGRLKDSVRRGGENIAASEVEEIIRELDFVSDCAVVGVDDELFGQEVKVHVEVPVGTVTEELAVLVQDHARARLAPFKVPRYVDIWRSLPRTPSERIAKHKIAQHPSDQLVATVDLGQRGRRTS